MEDSKSRLHPFVGTLLNISFKSSFSKVVVEHHIRVFVAVRIISGSVYWCCGRDGIGRYGRVP